MRKSRQTHRTRHATPSHPSSPSFVSFFEIGLGPIPWLIVAEMIHPKYVTLSMSVCSQLNWVCNFVVGFVFPAMNERLGYMR